MKNKLIIITGASNAIVVATAQQFADKGAIVLLVARNISNL